MHPPNFWRCDNERKATLVRYQTEYRNVCDKMIQEGTPSLTTINLRNQLSVKIAKLTEPKIKKTWGK